MARKSDPSVLVFGVGSFAHSHMQILREAGAHVSTRLRRKYGHYPPPQVGRCSMPGIIPARCRC